MSVGKQIKLINGNGVEYILNIDTDYVYIKTIHNFIVKSIMDYELKPKKTINKHTL